VGTADVSSGVEEERSATKKGLSGIQEGRVAEARVKSRKRGNEYKHRSD